MVELNQIILADCMTIMKDIPDGFFDIGIVDPPYGIGDKLHFGGGSHTKTKCKFGNMYSESGKKWDIRPDENYFKELFRVSKNQIIWGGNYFNLPPVRGFIIWDKDRAVENFSSIEFAWSSFDRHAKIFKYCNNAGFILKPFDYKIHPTQKPIALYRWLLQNYAKTGDKIIDTHSGSGSLACACHLEKFDFLAIEKDEDYYKLSVERLETLRSQGRLF